VLALLLSDIHGRVSLLRRIVKTSDYDLALVAGDLSNYAGGGYGEVLELLSESLPLTIVVPGNVDPPEILNLSLGNVVILHTSVVDVRGLLIAGVGGGIGFSFWGIPYLAEYHIADFVKNLSEELRRSSRALHILLTHTPPYNSGVDRLYSGEVVGSKALRNFLEEFKPLLHVCGHVHESRGVSTLGRTTVVNPGPAMVGYYAVSRVDLDRGRVDVELARVK
jgi:Icc-related predicted phosphoesterase